MHDIQTSFAECKRMLDVLSIPYNTATTISISHRVHGWLGQCRNGAHITISDSLLDDRVPVASLEQTILHELLHTCPACMNHGWSWKQYAQVVNNRYGYAISRCSDENSLQIPTELKMENRRTYKYTLVCDKCGHEEHRARASEFTRHPEYYIHRNCGGHFHHQHDFETAKPAVAAASVPRTYSVDPDGQLSLF